MSTRVLLLEDERDTRELLGRALQRAGYQCSLTETAADALAALAAAPVDVIVSDVMLGLDDWRGLHLLRELREGGSRVPVLIVTAFADVEKVKFALNQGAAYLLEKPFHAAELIDAIERVRSASQSGSALEQIFERARLTDKERTVAHHLLSGLSSNEIAQLEDNSPRTIRQHVSQIYAKCGVGSRAEFFRLAFTR
jgi:DNA-binding NarL/FixJ family response regulator